jgi:hypothetical protein
MHHAAIAAGLLREASAAVRVEATARAAERAGPEPGPAAPAELAKAGPEPAAVVDPEVRAGRATKWLLRGRARQLRSRPRDA